jgi:isopenicillin N synthase-like dioxygenase
VKLEHAHQLNWTAAREASEEIARICLSAPYTAPELLAEHRAKVVAVAEQMNRIAEALLMTGRAS